MSSNGQLVFTSVWLPSVKREAFNLHGNKCTESKAFFLFSVKITLHNCMRAGKVPIVIKKGNRNTSMLNNMRERQHLFIFSISCKLPSVIRLNFYKEAKRCDFPSFDILNKLEVTIYNYVLYQKNASFPNSIAVLSCVKILTAHSKNTFYLN